MSKLEVKHISKNFEYKKILNNLNLYVDTGEIVSIVGPSGVGKSTLFNIIAGLLEPSLGNVFLDGKSIINNPGRVSYMLQKDLLLPYKTIEQNVALPLLLKGINKKVAMSKVNELLNEFGFEFVAKAYPNELSGGMRQRIALLRTYMFSNNLILLDEPFSALDTFTKSEIQSWYLKIHKDLDLTTLFITHDIDEAIKLSNRVYILKGSQYDGLDSVRINKSGYDIDDFLVSNDFLSYKKEILNTLQSN
ncbi:ABC transporter ATP-binding protein [Companilactobacillus allii]|uniref:Nitrate ABC transporter ATP-binding protein n=1 Tax=Companilactobacillus allii TaxID=1847728 RepID=A0A1P8PZV4_9LACO|nr:ABC transporter ATP-binding protein [Companilactobacillus allii]APX71150.1 nitrate ABC transporter ATP-binding protein [Companilactobacillus allii]USQ68231.1 ABC transporter ATP-binding protein [Companilactobacillus allii]